MPRRFSNAGAQTPKIQPADAHAPRRRQTAAGRRVVGVAAAAFLVLASTGAAAGDPERGKALYGVCATCHGADAEGMQEMNAPALAGREEWYIVRQLNNFKSGARGSNPADVYGLQMAPMAQVLPDAQAIEDVAAYLRSLKNRNDDGE